MCPVCSREIATYRQLRGGDAINWVDASRCDASQLSAGLDRAYALQRLHVESANGALLSGAAAFVEIWRHLPAFAWIARFCSNRYALAVLDFAYDRFLVMRRLWRKL
jgi:predicted DCC family thiol-disulfide oxidoreductase YuxK